MLLEECKSAHGKKKRGDHYNSHDLIGLGKPDLNIFCIMAGGLFNN